MERMKTIADQDVERVAQALYDALPTWESIGQGEYRWPNCWPHQWRAFDADVWRQLARAALTANAALTATEEAGNG